MPDHGALVTSVRHTSAAPLSATLEQLGVRPGGPVLVVVGDAGRVLTEHQSDLRRRVVEQAIVPVVRELGATVITGGTDVGIMREMGRTLAEQAPDTVLIGVAPDAALTDATPAEPHHRMIRTDGAQFGDESQVLVAVAERLGVRGVVMVAIGGGAGVDREVASAQARRWPLLLVSDLGGTSERLAHQVRPRGGGSGRSVTEQSLDSNALVEIESARDERLVARALRWALGTDALLREAWMRYAAADEQAKALKVPIGRAAGALVVLALLTVAAAVVPIPGADDEVAWLVSRSLVTALPLVAGIVLAMLERSARAGTWVQMRQAAEAILRAIYTYRADAVTGVGGHPSARSSRELADQLAGIDASAGLRIADAAVAVPPWPPAGLRARVPAADQLVQRLDAQTYDIARVQDQLTYLSRESRRKARIASGWSIAVYVSAAFAAFALAVSWAGWPGTSQGAPGGLVGAATTVAALGAALAAALVSWRQYKRWDEDSAAYRSAALAVRSRRASWLSSSPLAQASPRALATYISDVESALADEGAEWERALRQAHQAFMETRRGR